MNKREFFKTGMLGIGALFLSRSMNALEYYPKKTDTSWVVIYSTWCGSSRDAAVWISEGMNGIANVFDIRENPDLSGYENIILGGSIRSAKVSPEMENFLNNNKKQFKGKIRGLFVVCGNMMQLPTEQTKTDLIDNHLAQLCEVKNVPSKVFLGRITYGLLDTEALEVIKGYDMPEYDNLKRTNCLEFGKEILTNVR